MADGRLTTLVVLKERPSRLCHPTRIAGRDCNASCVRHDDEARAFREGVRQNRATAGRGTIRPDAATVHALEDVTHAWKDIAGNLPAVHGMSTSLPGGASKSA